MNSADKKKLLKVVYLINGFGEGGQEKQLCELLKEIRKDSTLFTIIPLVINWSNKKRDEKYRAPICDLGIEIIDLTSGHFVGRLFELIRIILSFKPDIVHSYANYLNFPAYVASKIKNIPAVGAMRASFKMAVSENLIVSYLSYHFNDYYIANSYSAKREMEAFYIVNNMKTKKVFFLPNQVETKFPIKSSYDLNGRIRSVSVGRIDRNKKIDFLIRLNDFLNREGYSIEHHHFGDGKERLFLERFLKEKHLSTFCFKGSDPGIAKRLSEYDFFIHAAEYEGTANVILEAMAAGLPVISSECGDSSMLITNYQNGFVVAKGESSKFGSIMMELLENLQLRRKIGSGARKYIEEKYADMKLTELIATIYEEVLSDFYQREHAKAFVCAG